MNARLPMILLALVCLAARAPRRQPASAPVEKPTLGITAAPAPRATPAPVAQSAADETRCAACHTTGSWHESRFNHDKTGFPLRDAHAHVSCKNCHELNFDVAIARDCAGCHRDPHNQEFGNQCTGCHDERNWQSAFSVDAHRGTIFPLTGAHAALPCQECHTQMRARRFALAASTCDACHMPDYVRAATVSIDHQAAGFGTDCHQCHSPVRFTPARFPQHATCFVLDGTVHGNIACLTCHTSLLGARPSGACNTGTAACSACHTHACAKTDAQHTNVMGYQCKDQKCYECHRFSKAR